MSASMVILKTRFMRTLLFTFTLLFTIYIFHGCSNCSCKKVPCPAFSDASFESWLPYQPGQQLVFKNQSSFDTITLSGINKSEAYEANQGCYNGDNGCYQDLSIGSNEVAGTTGNYMRKFSVNYFSTTTFSSSAYQKTIELQLREFKFTANDFSEMGFAIATGLYSGSFSPSTMLNGTSYNNVQIIVRDTTDISLQQPYKVYLSKGVGLIAYETCPTRALWVKQ
jgi:hypothetical protein